MLIDYLMENKNLNRKKAKAYLTNGFVNVNGKVITKYNYIVKADDIVTINLTDKYNNFKVLYEDKYLIAVYKKSGLLSISTTKEKEKTLYHQVSDYIKTKNKNSKIFVIHRLDKETSGIVIFAKDEKTKKIMQDNWDSLVKKRNYLAIVEGKLTGSARLVNYLKENSSYKVYISSDGKKAITNYQVIKSNDNYSLLNINLETGRKNQIRVQLANINHPVVGDIKYDSTKNPINRLCLQANELSFIHPINKKEINIKVEIDNEFKKIIKGL